MGEVTTAFTSAGGAGGAGDAPATSVTTTVGGRGLAGARRLLEAHDRTAALAWLQARQQPAVPTVVVLGEVSRGKSSLVNALLGVAAAPVAAQATTAVAVVYRPPDAHLSAGRARVSMTEGDVDVDIAELASYVALGGEHLANVRSATVAVESRLLHGITLVDTPGTGGLDAAHRRTAVEAAVAGTVVLLVADAGTPLIEGELQLLTDAAAAIDQIVVAVAKTDLHPTGWDAVTRSTRRHLRALGTDRMIQVVGVSAAAAALATELGADPDSAGLVDDVVAASGIPALAAALRNALDNAVAERGLLRAARSGIDDLATVLHTRQAALDVDDGIRVEVAAERARLRALRDAVPTQKAALHDALRQARHAVAIEATAELNAVRRRWHNRIANITVVGALQREALARELAGQLTTVVRESRLHWLDHHVRIAGGLFEQAEPGQELARVIEELRAVTGDPVVDVVGLGRPAVAAAAAVIGHIGGVLSTSVITGQVWAAALVVGMVKAGAGLHGSMRDSLRRWVDRQIDATNTAVASDLERTAGAVLPSVLEEFSQRLRQREQDLTAAIQAAAAAERSRVQRRRQLQEIDGVLREITGVRADLDAGIAALGGGTDR